jgi:adenylate cyclase
MNPLLAYLPQDRRWALARGNDLPEDTYGTALFADLSGFTPLTEALDRTLGARQGTEEMTRQINRVYHALIAEVDRFGGSVIGFAGDAITCWFDGEKVKSKRQKAKGDQPSSDLFTFYLLPSAQRAAACALALQAVMHQFASIPLPDGSTTALALKVALASGPARRLVVGDPSIQLFDVLAGATLARMAAAEHLAERDEVLIDESTAAALDNLIQVAEWRTDDGTGERFAVLREWNMEHGTLRNDLGSDMSHAQFSMLNAQSLKPWLLPAVYERHQAGLGAFLTELRPVVALFLRFSGIDYEADPAAGTQLDVFIRRVQAILARYDGTLLQLTIGDKGSYLCAAFGAPTTHEDDPRRAARTADACLALPNELGFLQPLQAGISRGVVRAGAYGSSTRMTYGVLGDEVNLAARLMGRAAPGEILVSGRVRTALAPEFMLEPLEPIPLKGMPEPLPVFRLAGARARAVRLPEPAYALPMVGRAAELAQIGAKLDLALARQGQIIGITAEAGLGKSRLLAEVIRLGHRNGLRGFGGACQSYGTNTPYLVWESIWRAFFDLDPATPVRRQVRALEGTVDEWVPERLPALPLLGPLLGLALAENDFTRNLEPQQCNSALHALLRECLQAAAREAAADGTGLLFVLEDLHWIDAASHDLLEDLARATSDLPVLWVLAYRPPELLRLQAPHIEMLDNFTRVDLRPLTDIEAAQAIRAKLAQLLPERKGAATPALVARITAKAQGNPFYVEELLNYLRDCGIDPQDTHAIEQLDLPTSLHTLILSRIDQLSARQQVELKVASVIGRLFQVAWLHSAYPVLGAAELLKADFQELARLELTPLDTPEPELTYLFKHIVTQEVAYESLSAETRAALHVQLATFLETRASADLAPYLDLLAFHYDRGDNLEKRRHYLRRAGVAASARYANDAAIDYLSRALALTPDNDLAARFELLLAREQVYAFRGERAAQREDLDGLERLADALNDDQRRATVAWRRIEYAFDVDDYQMVSAFAPAAETLAQRAGLPMLAARFAGTLALVLALYGDKSGAYARAEEGLRLARDAGDRQVEGYVLQWYGVVASMEGDHTKARAILERGIVVSRESGDVRQVAVTQTWCGQALCELGDFAAARGYVEAGLAFHQLTGDSVNTGSAVGMRGVILLNQGNFHGAQAAFVQALVVVRSNENVIMQGRVLIGLVRAAMGLHELVTAYKYEQEALAITRAIKDQQGESNILADLCWTAASLGDFKTAREAAARAAELSEIQGDRKAAAHVQLSQALMALWEEDYTTAAQRAAQVLERARSARYPLLEPPALIVLGHAALGQGRTVDAAAAYRTALDLRRGMGQLHTPAEPLAGLAQALLAEGDHGAALTQVEAVLTHLDGGGTLDGALDPMRILLTCYEVLSVVRDPRASAVLADAHGRLQKLAMQLVDEDARLLFEQAPHHRAILAAWEAQEWRK